MVLQALKISNQILTCGKLVKTYPNPGKAPDIFYKEDICPIRNLLGQLGRKWPSLIMCHLSFGSHRFSELRGAIPDISQRMLSQTLRELERDGLVERDMQPSVPPRVDYSLTPLGETYIAPMQNMLSWGAKHQDRIDVIRRAYDTVQGITETIKTPLSMQ